VDAGGLGGLFRGHLGQRRRVADAARLLLGEHPEKIK
jgi:hypothetical protein